MLHRVAFRTVLISVCVVLLTSTAVNGRYLPTRSNEDSLDKLRDLLRDILETDKSSPVSPGGHASLYEGAGHYPYSYGGPKYLRKREINGWDSYAPPALYPVN